MQERSIRLKNKLEGSGIHSAVLDQYPFPFVEVEKIAPPQGGSGDHLFHVRSEKAEYCLRRYDRYEYRGPGLDPTAKILFEHSVAEHARAGGFREMIRIVPSRAGDGLVRVGGEMYALFEWIRGKIYEKEEVGLSPVRVERAGRALARLHRAMEGFQAPPGGDGALPEGDVPTFLKGILEAIPHIEAALGTNGSGRTSKIRSRLGQLGRMTEKYLFALQGGPHRELLQRAVESGSFVIHGDYKHNNIAFDEEDRILKLWDLHRCRAELPLVDLCDGLLNFSRGDMGVAQRFLWSYHEGRPLDEDERSTLAVLVHLRFLYHVYYFITGLFVEEESAPRAALTLMRQYGNKRNARRTEGLISFAQWMDRRRFGKRLVEKITKQPSAGAEG